MPVGFDQVTLCNMALSHVGHSGTIESIDESNPPAKQCKLWYDAARLATLAAFNWSFARRAEVLAPHGVAAPTNRWAYRYQLPSNCVAPRLIENPKGNEADAIPFEVEEASDDTTSIVTDEAEATLIFTKDLSDVSRFSFHFCDTMSLRLAMYINPALTGKVAIYNRLRNSYNESTVMAPYVDTSGSVPKAPRDPSWIRARS